MVEGPTLETECRHIEPLGIRTTQNQQVPRLQKLLARRDEIPWSKEVLDHLKGSNGSRESLTFDLLDKTFPGFDSALSAGRSQPRSRLHPDDLLKTLESVHLLAERPESSSYFKERTALNFKLVAELVQSRRARLKNSFPSRRLCRGENMLIPEGVVFRLRIKLMQERQVWPWVGINRTACVATHVSNIIFVAIGLKGCLLTSRAGDFHPLVAAFQKVVSICNNTRPFLRHEICGAYGLLGD